MKRILAAVLALTFGLATFAQDSTKMKPKVSVSPYVATGLSIGTSTDFLSGSYFSVEVGIMVNNLMIGAVFGVNDLNSFNGVGNYWYEGKVAYMIPLDFFDVYGLFGVGSFTSNERKNDVFLEYGGGISKTVYEGLGVFLQVASWDKAVYVTPGLSYTF